jgi:hypothetical protein
MISTPCFIGYNFEQFWLCQQVSSHDYFDLILYFPNSINEHIVLILLPFIRSSIQSVMYVADIAYSQSNHNI